MKRARPWHRLSASNARQLLARIPRDDIFGVGIELRDIRRGFAGMAPAILARLSCSGGEAILQDGMRRLRGFGRLSVPRAAIDGARLRADRAGRRRRRARGRDQRGNVSGARRQSSAIRPIR